MPEKPRLLLTGASGLVGREIYCQAQQKFAVSAPVHTRALSGPPAESAPLDLEVPGSGHRLVESCRPDLVIHLAALSSQGLCEKEPERARRVNRDASRELAEAAAARGAAFLYFSTDQVFDGEHAPYRESDSPRPLTAYGRSKAEAEEQVLAVHPAALVLRVALVLGRSPSGRAGAVDKLRVAANAARPVDRFEEEWRTPVGALEVALRNMTPTLNVTRFSSGSTLPYPSLFRIVTSSSIL